MREQDWLVGFSFIQEAPGGFQAIITQDTPRD
jgi:hypothetical protein